MSNTNERPGSRTRVAVSLVAGSRVVDSKAVADRRSFREIEGLQTPPRPPGGVCLLPQQWQQSSASCQARAAGAAARLAALHA